MPIISDCTYDALLYVCKNLSKFYGNVHAINWDTDVIQNYCLERYGEKGKTCFSQEHQRKGGVNAYKIRRSTFVKRAKMHLVKDNTLYKMDKPVLRKGEYDKVLRRLHEETGHRGTKKLRHKMCLNYADVDYATVDRFVGNCSFCREKKRKQIEDHCKKKKMDIKLQKPIKIRKTFQRLGIDLSEFTDPRNDKDKHNLLVMIDFFSRFAWIKVLPAGAVVDGDLKSSATGEMVGLSVLEVLLGLGRIPDEIHSNYGTRFTDGCVKVVNHTVERLQQKTTRCAPFNPSIATKLERVVATVKGVLNEVFTGNDSIDVPFTTGNGRQVVNGILADDNTNNVSFVAAMACSIYNQRPHEELPKKLCPVDVWQPSHRIQPSRDAIPSNLSELQPGDVIELVTTEPPQFDEQQFDVLKQVCEEMAAAQAIEIKETEVTTSND